jgi:hypothetical protein
VPGRLVEYRRAVNAFLDQQKTAIVLGHGCDRDMGLPD